ncbi:MAG: 16S rRNA (guanine(527)-N(7))-methyltransferase RsmG [Armatimonadetes bacterium]|nr:16S rRNA (guanine(527)-N(7))-methyltransferase RsmG [Armatimonadota bacterium]
MRINKDEFDQDAERLAAGAADFGIALSAEQIQQFRNFQDLITEWNRRLNLTRITPEDFVPLHFLDSLCLMSFIPQKRPLRLLDLGSGAGFPGIPLAITDPDLDITLLEATQKKARFLVHAVRTLELPRISVLPLRAEEAARMPGYHCGYDIVAARAVAPLDRLCGWMMPFLKPDGVAIAMKADTTRTREELKKSEKAIQLAGGEMVKAVVIGLPATDIQRTLVLIKRRRLKR